jgi:hypothetical protein
VAPRRASILSRGGGPAATSGATNVKPVEIAQNLGPFGGKSNRLAVEAIFAFLGQRPGVKEQNTWPRMAVSLGTAEGDHQTPCTREFARSYDVGISTIRRVTRAA